MVGENDKSASQLPIADVLTGAEIMVLTQAGESRQIPLTGIIAYLLSGDARIDWGNIIGNLSAQEDLVSALNGKSNTGHTHAIAQVVGLQPALNNRALVGHTHTVEQVDGLQGTLDGKANTGHTHTMAQVSGLGEALAGKAGTSHSHGVASIKEAVIDLLFPVGGAPYMTTDSRNPAEYLEYGTWVAWGGGTHLSFVGTSDSVTLAAGVSGSHTHEITLNQLPEHRLKIASNTVTAGSDFLRKAVVGSGDEAYVLAGTGSEPDTYSTSSVGAGEAIPIRPRTTSIYAWQRTA